MWFVSITSAKVLTHENNFFLNFTTTIITVAETFTDQHTFRSVEQSVPFYLASDLVALIEINSIILSNKANEGLNDG